jgi:DNA-binding MarR family transcriptional regulator
VILLLEIELGSQMVGSKGKLESALEDFIIGVHRLSTALAESKVLTESGFGISEWAVLKALGDQKEFQQNILRKSGVSRQRIRKLLFELETRQMVTLSQSEGSDRRHRIIAATPHAMEIRRNAAAAFANLISLPDAQHRSIARDPEKLAKRLEAFAVLADRISRIIRQSSRRSDDDDWPEQLPQTGRDRRQL